MQRALVAASALAITAAALVAACDKKPTYDDAPIARPDRKKKDPEPPETFDVEKICAQLVDLPGAGVDAAQKSDLREMCRNGLVALQKRDPDEYACRCHCIGAAGDLLAVERCTRYCGAEDPKHVCDHVVGVEQETNDGGVLDQAHDDCVKSLQKLQHDDVARWSCTVRCLVAATAKDDALACNAKCSGAFVPDAGSDVGAMPKPTPTPTVEY